MEPADGFSRGGRGARGHHGASLGILTSLCARDETCGVAAAWETKLSVHLAWGSREVLGIVRWVLVRTLRLLLSLQEGLRGLFLSNYECTRGGKLVWKAVFCVLSF